MSSQILQKSRFYILAFFVAFSVVMALSAAYFWPFYSDDALISLRYTVRMLEGKGLTWTEGRPVEGYSNLLWVLLNAVPIWLGFDPVLGSRILGFLCLTSVIASCSVWFLRFSNLKDVVWPLATSLLFYAMSLPIVIWAIGGLEQPLYGALIALTVPLYYRLVDDFSNTTAAWLLSFVLGLICITRPDGPVFSVTAAASIMLAGILNGDWRRSIQLIFILAVFPILFYGGQLLFRLSYYGDYVPNTAYAKIAPTGNRFFEGIKYLGKGMANLTPFAPIAILSAIGMLFSPAARARSFYPLSTLALWSAYVIFIGGDIFPAYRHIVPLVVIMLFTHVEGMVWLQDKLSQFKSFSLNPTTLALLTAILVLPFAFLQFRPQMVEETGYENWVWQGEEIGLLLNQAFADEKPVVAVTAAGSIPFWSDLPSLDMLGLNDYHIARNRPEDIGEGFLGHELGDANYILEQQPDIIIFHTGTIPLFSVGRQLEQNDLFNTNYNDVVIQLDLATEPSRFYFYKYSPKIGIEQSAGDIRIPTYLLKGGQDGVYLNQHNELVASLSSQESLYIDFETSAGSTTEWAVEIDGQPSENLNIDIKLEQEESWIAVTLSTDQTDPIEIQTIVLRTED